MPNHESAVEMAEIAQRRAESEFVEKLADDIVRTQSEEISTMRRGGSSEEMDDGHSG